MTESFYTFMGALEALVEFLNQQPVLAQEEETRKRLAWLKGWRQELLNEQAAEVSNSLAALRHAHEKLSHHCQLREAELTLAAAHLAPGTLVARASMVDFDQEKAGPDRFFAALADATAKSTGLLEKLKAGAVRLLDVLDALDLNIAQVDPELKIIMDRLRPAIKASLPDQPGGGESSSYWPSGYVGSSSSSHG